MSKTLYIYVVMIYFEYPAYQPNFYCSAVFSAEFCTFCKNSANPNISRKICSASLACRYKHDANHAATRRSCHQLAVAPSHRRSMIVCPCKPAATELLLLRIWLCHLVPQTMKRTSPAAVDWHDV